MAGDWLKIEAATPDKPEVFAIAVAMGWDDSDLAFGKLFKMWRWFDQHTVDGNARGVTFQLLDRFLGVTGFAEAVSSVGWLRQESDGVSLPNFGLHNGKSAKVRAQTAKRVAEHKANANGNAEGNADSVSDALAREEKRREEEYKDAPAPIPRKKKLVSLPDNFGISERVKAWAEKDGHRHLAKRLEHFVGYAKRSGKQYADWDEAFMCAIREDWAKLSNHPQQGAAPQSVVREWAV